MPKISKPEFGFKLNWSFILTLMLALGILGLGVWQSRSARTIGVLQETRTDLECQLGNCTEQLETLNTTFLACSDNLASCNSELTQKIGSLNACENSKSDINQDYQYCKYDLLQYRDDYNDLQDSYDDCQSVLDDKEEDLDNCQDNLGDVQGNYNTMKNRYRDLCNDGCSEECEFDSGSHEYECPQLTAQNTTTTSSTTTTV
jgi:chromosome segregation ATPase